MDIIKKDIWSYLRNSDKKIIIYGMGNGADKIIDELEKIGVGIYGVMASDDFVRGQSFRGFTVKRLSDFEQENIIILTAFGSQRTEVIENILRLAEKHTVFAPDVPVYGDNIFNKEFYDSNRDKFQKVFEILADDFSKKVLENEINFKLSGKLKYLTDIFTDKDEAFRILDLGKNESYLDLGAYRGDTIEEFLGYTDGYYRHITALEPDRKNYKKLGKYTKNLRDTRIWNMGIWNSDCDMYFDMSLGRGSSIQVKGSKKVPVTSIDTLYQVQKISYIKFDVEGAEKQALLGGINTLRRDKPKINLALYHRSEDIFELPLLLHEINPDYRIYIRQHPHIPAWDMNLYAI